MEERFLFYSIANHRIINGISYKELAEAIGVNEITYIRNEEVLGFSFEELHLIAKFFRMPLSSLVNSESNDENEMSIEGLRKAEANQEKNKTVLKENKYYLSPNDVSLEPNDLKRTLFFGSTVEKEIKQTSAPKSTKLLTTIDDKKEFIERIKKARKEREKRQKESR